MTLSPTALSALLQISDSALPTGGFSHSFGMEQYLSRGEITDAATFSDWLAVYVRTQLTYTDALLIRLAYARLDGAEEPVAEAAQPPAEVLPDPLADLADEVYALTLPEQVRTASAAMARRLRAIGADALGVTPPRWEATHPALEFAWISHARGIDLTTAMHAHLVTAVTTMTQNAVRGIPIGQSAGQAVIASAGPWIEQAIETSMSLQHNDLGAVAPGLEIAQMQHERLRARMFMS